MSPEWVTAVGMVLLGAVKFGYEVWKDHRPQRKPPGHDEGEPPAAAA